MCPEDASPRGWGWCPRLLPSILPHGFYHSRFFPAGVRVGSPPRRHGAQGQPCTLISAESDTRRAESVDIYYCSQESGAPGGGGRDEAREGGESGACGQPACVSLCVHTRARSRMEEGQSARKIKVAGGPGSFQADSPAHAGN